MTTAAEALPDRARRGVMSRTWRFVARHALTVYALLAVAYLLLPIVIVILFSFNHPTGRFNYLWHRFTFDNWLNWNSVLGIQGAVQTSLEIAALATLVATALGTMIALALVRHRFIGRGVTSLIIFLPMATPEIVMGSSLLTLFLNDQNTLQLGFWTIFIAHVMFTISFVVVTVKARLIGFDRHLEEAAMDLGANEWATFRKVTLPLIAPAMLAAALLGFALSIDDFVITYLNAGDTVTFPLFVWGAARVATPPQINVIGTAIFAVAVSSMLVHVAVQMRRARKGNP